MNTMNSSSLENSLPLSALAPPLPVTLFSMVLGLSGLGYALLNGATLWHIPEAAGEAVLLLALLVWAGLLLAYGWQFLRHPQLARQEFEHAVTGSMASLIGISTLVLVPGAARHGAAAAWALAAFGIGCHLALSTRHAARLWQGGRSGADTTPALYLPDVAGNFTSAAALGVLGQTDWAWLFFGAGVCSWLTLEPVIKNRIWHAAALAPARRPLMGIQAAPPAVCAASLLLIDPHAAASGPWVPMLLGYALLQLAQAIRLLPWLGEQRFASSYWAYTFGMTSALNCCMKLALAGNAAARALALPMMVAVGAFIVYLLVRTTAGK